MNIENIKGSVGIIDADLINKPSHNFPNLALMKISAYLKNKGIKTELVSFDSIGGLFGFDWYIVGKVFTDTIVPDIIYTQKNIIYGGTGFYYDKAEQLPYAIEHTFPNYNLYKHAATLYNSGKSDYYLNHSIGFTTRGCIRQCSFCVNKNYKKVEKCSDISEFYDPSKKYITLLDDNITAYSGFFDVWQQLKDTGKPFTFKQGMDFRLLTEKKIKVITETAQYGRFAGRKGQTFYFAFDNIKDSEIINKKAEIWKRYVKRSTVVVFYVLTGYDENNIYDHAFYETDYNNLIERIMYLFENRFYPYIMMHENLKNSPFYHKVIELRNYCNVPMYCTNSSFREYLNKKNKESMISDYLTELDMTYKY